MSAPGNIALPLLAAIADILQDAPEVQAIIPARAAPFCVPFEDVQATLADPTATVPLPIYVYDYVDEREIGPGRSERELIVTLDAIAEGNNALEIITDLTAIARTVLTWNAFNVRGVDAFVLRAQKQATPIDPEATRNLRLHRLTLTIRAKAP